MQFDRTARSRIRFCRRKHFLLLQDLGQSTPLKRGICCFQRLNVCALSLSLKLTVNIFPSLSLSLPSYLSLPVFYLTISFSFNLILPGSLSTYLSVFYLTISFSAGFSFSFNLTLAMSFSFNLTFPRSLSLHIYLLFYLTISFSFNLTLPVSLSTFFLFLC